MTQEQSAAEDERAAQEQPGGERPPLVRDESHRVVAGVCGGSAGTWTSIRWCSGWSRQCSA